MSRRGGDSLARAALRSGYGAMLGVHAVASIPTSGGRGQPRVFYGGARMGDVGGPLVKVKRLRDHFPEQRWRYNLVYCLSNAPYLPDFALGVLRRRGMPIVHNQNGVFYPAWYGGDWQAQNARMARSYHQARHVFWQSAFCRLSADRFLGARQGEGEVLYNAVDTTRFTPAATRADGPARFLVTGKFDEHMFYRLDGTLRGLAVVVRQGLDAHLTIAGWTAPEAARQAQSLAAELGLSDRVRLTGAYTQAAAPDIYRAADIYVMTKHNDPCPNTVLEALACGLPVVYSASGGVPELVGEAGQGVFVPEDWERVHAPDPAALGDSMAHVAARRADLSAAARARAIERFDIKFWIARHRAVFEGLVR